MEKKYIAYIQTKDETVNQTETSSPDLDNLPTYRLGNSLFIKASGNYISIDHISYIWFKRA